MENDYSAGTFGAQVLDVYGVIEKILLILMILLMQLMELSYHL